MTPALVAALSARIADDACQRAVVVPISTPGRRWASIEDANAAAGYARDDESVADQRRLLGWMRSRAPPARRTA